MNANTYRISKEDGEWVVADKKSGIIIAYFDRKNQAEEYLADQVRADEQSNVMSDYNHAAMIRELASEFAAEFS